MATDVIMIVSGERAIQEALRDLFGDSGCKLVVVNSVADARRVQPSRSTLVLVDPAIGLDAAAELAPHDDVVEIPVRISATGVRRIARRSDPELRVLTRLVAARCKR